MNPERCDECSGTRYPSDHDTHCSLHPKNIICPVFRPDHNGECLNCDEWIDEHSPEAITAGEEAAMSDEKELCPECAEWEASFKLYDKAQWELNQMYAAAHPEEAAIHIHDAGKVSRWAADLIAKLKDELGKAWIPPY